MRQPTYVSSCLARLCIGGIFATCLATEIVSAGTIDVAVLDRSGNPVPDVVVMAESKSETPLSPAADLPTSFEMNQRQLMFDPYVLVVPIGASVSFLNSDTTAHHVYSFSKTKRFALPLHKGRVPDPVLFQASGVVTLGCNIHDHMVGYIVVAESHLHSVTDSDGLARLTTEHDIENIQIRIWSPRFRDKPNQLVKDASASMPVRFTLTKKLKPPYKPNPLETSEWEDY